MAVNNLPSTLDYPLDERAVTAEDLSVDTPATMWITIEDAEGNTLAKANPLVIQEGAVSGLLGKLHGQSGESIGINTSWHYFDFARNCSFLDASSHQANDFQVNNAFWAYLNELTANFHEDGRFVTFPGYEWSGNTAVGGDRNVFFREEGRQIHRSSHALLPDRSDIDTDANDAGALFEALADEDCVVFAHVGGRYADIAFAHDGKIERSMELHSAWGTFEWLIEDCFDLGHRVGVVASSDGHKGRPRSSYPGASTFGAYGGLTCFLTNELTRDGIFLARFDVDTTGTTGNRIHLDVGVTCAGGATWYADDPKDFPDTATEQVARLMMGDIAKTSDKRAALNVKAISTTPIERIAMRNAKQVLKTVRGFDESDLGERVRVVWSGAEYRGRGRETNWIGSVAFHGRTINRMAKVNAWNHERKLEQVDDSTVAFDAITTGNFAGFDAWLDGSGGEIEVNSNLVKERINLDDVGLEDTIFEAEVFDDKSKSIDCLRITTHPEIEASLEIELDDGKDDILWVSVYTEDGFQA